MKLTRFLSNGLEYNVPTCKLLRCGGFFSLYQIPKMASRTRTHTDNNRLFACASEYFFLELVLNLLLKVQYGDGGQ